ncbi:MAG: alpha/beta fold hydrolase [Rhodopseudomonas palustris]|uniref:Alpha/beta fold hydrolase n=1 Tax=Rhodopseudomonas palustris TaxID=1076 RepID=A0A933W1G3_RHOPL|nr:alpha/beta fold hydrolase [Rhodopseudomonas palustris]
MGLIRKAARILGWAVTVAGVVVLVLAALIAVPVTKPPALASIANTAGAVDRSTMPALARFYARDGSELAYRRYPAQQGGVRPVAIVVHGSSGSSIAVHALAQALAARGVETFAPDIRGHGGSGTRGDIGYRGQLGDDFADVVAMVKAARPGAPLVLIGHSSGGGFALRMAGSATGKEFSRTVLLAPFLGYSEPTNRAKGGGWASPDIPRIIGLSALRAIGVACCDQLPVIGFAVQPHSEKYVVATYSFRLLMDFAASRDFRTDLAAATSPVTVISGETDELMVSDKYQATMGDRVRVRILPGINHMGIVGDPAAVSAIADDVVSGGAGT